MTSRRCLLALRGLLLLTFASCGFAQQQASADFQGSVPARVFELVLPQGHLFGDWGGVQPQLEAAGIEATLTLVTDFAGNPSGGRAQGWTAPSSLAAGLLFDLDKIYGVKDASVLVTASERWGRSLSADYIGNVFATQQIFGYQTYRLIDVSYQQKLLKDRLEIRIGRFAALDDFLVSAYNCLFMQLGFCGNPAGILFNAPGISAYSSTWAAGARVNATERSYVMVGVYNGDPAVHANNRHGVDLSLKGPLFAMGEAGYQINGLPGDNSQRLGNYKLGAWYDGNELTDFESGARTRGSWGVYGLFDQVLIPFGIPGSNRGLGVMGSVIYAPDPHVQKMPFFFNAGVVARGIFDSRPVDTLGLGVVYGRFSGDLQLAEQMEQQLNRSQGIQNHEAAIELTYRIYFNRSALFVQPDFQYIIQPGGTGHVSNAVVLGAQFGINF